MSTGKRAEYRLTYWLQFFKPGITLNAIGTTINYRFLAEQPRLPLVLHYTPQ